MINIDYVVKLAQGAGVRIMEIYSSDIDVSLKSDDSPLTQADLTSHTFICDGLKMLTPEIPILSEESSKSDIAKRLDWDCFWLIDPLDGTKEFIKKNGEFTVNIALIKNGLPILGVVYAPALERTYIGEIGAGAFVIDGKGSKSKLLVSSLPTDDRAWRVVGSRSHQADEFKTFVEKLPKAEIVSMGSSLKLCLVAEGSADLYPRLGLTSEWDTAAAQAVVEAAGGQVLHAERLEPLTYNQRDTLLNPHFIVCAAKHEAWT